MHKDIKKIWIDALRSGNYRQGTGVLRDKLDQYCCLGVLCDVVKSHKKIEEDWTLKIFAYSFKGDLYGLDDSVSEYVGIKEATALNVLMDMNDRGMTFNQIADWIEENL